MLFGYFSNYFLPKLTFFHKPTFLMFFFLRFFIFFKNWSTTMFNLKSKLISNFKMLTLSKKKFIYKFSNHYKNLYFLPPIIFLTTNFVCMGSKIKLNQIIDFFKNFLFIGSNHLFLIETQLFFYSNLFLFITSKLSALLKFFFRQFKHIFYKKKFCRFKRFKIKKLKKTVFKKIFRKIWLFKKAKKFLKKKNLKNLNWQKKTQLYLWFNKFSKKQIIFKSFFFYLWAWLNIYPKLKKTRRRGLKLFKLKRRLNKFNLFLSKFFIKIQKTLKLVRLHFLVYKKYTNFYFPELIQFHLNVTLFFMNKRFFYFNFMKYFSFFLIAFLEKLLKNPICIVFKFYRNKNAARIIFRQFKKLIRYQFLVGRGFFLREMLYVLWVSFRSKDTLFLVLWIRRTMERLKLKKHRIFLITLRYILRNYFTPYFKTLKCLGYRCVVWGKVGVVGNSKTRNFICQNQFYSLTTKNYRVSHEFTIVRTHTGALGLTFYLIY